MLASASWRYKEWLVKYPEGFDVVAGCPIPEPQKRDRDATNAGLGGVPAVSRRAHPSVPAAG